MLFYFSLCRLPLSLPCSFCPCLCLSLPANYPYAIWFYFPSGSCLLKPNKTTLISYLGLALNTLAKNWKRKSDHRDRSWVTGVRCIFCKASSVKKQTQKVLCLTMGIGLPSTQSSYKKLQNNPKFIKQKSQRNKKPKYVWGFGGNDRILKFRVLVDHW